MNKKIIKLLSVVLSLSMISTLSACSKNTDSQKIVVPDESTSKTSSTNTNMSINLSDLVTYDENDYYTDYMNENPNYIKFNGTSAEFQGTGVAVDKNIININQAGTYVLSGNLDDGQIIVNETNDGVVKLVLNNANISSSTGAPIYVMDAKKVVVSLVEGTENTISDGKTYVNSSTDEPNSAIFSKSDLTITGTGTLNVNGNYNNAVTSKDELKITDGNINITSVDDGLMGRDMVAVKNGNIKINSGGHGIKSTNDTDTTKGYIVLESGTYNLTSGADSINAQTSLYVAGGEYTITAEDDGIHADTSIEIGSGKIDILKSYEGIESGVITISGGDIQVKSSDDGINVAGGNDGSSVNGRPGQNLFTENSDNKLNINGGNIFVDSAGDGLDANGSIYMAGGTVTVNGPTSNGNGALDYDGEFNITGGNLISAGSSGMAQGPSDTSTQNSVVIKYTDIQKSGTPVIIKDSTGNKIFTFAPSKDFQTVVFSSKDLKLNETYSLYSDDTDSGKLADFTISELSTWISDKGEAVTKGGNFGGPNGGGRGMKDGGTPPTDGQRPTPPNGAKQPNSAATQQTPLNNSTETEQTPTDATSSATTKTN